MKPDQPKPENKPATVQRPWTAITIGVFLLLCGIGASVYSFIAITWTAESTAEVIYIESSTAPTSVDNKRTDEEFIDPDRPIRTSTTRRRTTPREVRRPSRTATTLAREESGSSKTTGSDEKTTSSDGDEDDNTDSDEDKQQESSSDEKPSEDEEQRDDQSEPASEPADPQSIPSVD